MKVDYHFHLEEGPYSLSWIQRTIESLREGYQTKASESSYEESIRLAELLKNRMDVGEYSREWFNLYLNKAKEIGLKEVGIVDHLYRFIEYKAYYEKYIDIHSDELGKLQKYWLDQVCIRSIGEFVSFIESEKKVWEQEGIQLKLGIEADYFPGGEDELKEILSEYPYDYIIGSVHFQNGWGFDNPQVQGKFEETPLLNLYHIHFDILESAIKSDLFDIIAHLDNLKVFGFRPDENELKHYYVKIAKLLKQYDIATEVNAGLFYRYPIKEMCPSPTFLSVLAEKDVAITTSSDAHYPEDLGKYNSLQLEMLQSNGFSQIATFSKRKRYMRDLNERIGTMSENK